MSDQSHAANPSVIIDFNSIEADPYWNSRPAFAPASVKELADSIRRLGLLQPLVVQPSTGGYTLVAGFRRYHAIKWWLKWDRVTVLLTHSDARSVNLAENLDRTQLTILDEAKAVSAQSGSIKQIAKRLGKSTAWVSTRKKLMALPKQCRFWAAAGELSEDDINELAKCRTPVAAARKLIASRRWEPKSAKRVRRTRSLKEMADMLVHLASAARQAGDAERKAFHLAGQAISWAANWIKTEQFQACCTDTPETVSAWGKTYKHFGDQNKVEVLVGDLRSDLHKVRVTNAKLKHRITQLLGEKAKKELAKDQLKLRTSKARKKYHAATPGKRK